MARRGAVDHDEVVLARPFVLLDLAEHDDVVDARSGRADHVDHAGPVEALGDPAESVVVQVLLERIGRRQVDDRERVTVAVGEQLVQCRLAVQFDHEDTSPGSGCRTGDDCRYRCLPHTTLPGDHHDVRGGQRPQGVLAHRRHSCAD